MTNEEILSKLYEINDINENLGIAQRLDNLIKEMSSRVRAECAKSNGLASPTKAMEKILKKCKREQANRTLHYQWVDEENRQCVCDGYVAYRLTNHLPIEPRPEDAEAPTNLDSIFRKIDPNLRTRVDTPEISELKSFIKLDSAKFGKKHTPVFAFGENLPSVNAEYLIDAITILGGMPEIYVLPGVTGLKMPIYIKGENGECVIMPVLRSKG